MDHKERRVAVTAENSQFLKKFWLAKPSAIETN